mgnify:CR=1 FL=1
MIEAEEVLKLLRETGALLEGHFRLTSGLHTDQYLQCAQTYQYPEVGSRLSQELAILTRDLAPEVVVGPAMGGVIIAYEVARFLGARALFGEREGSKMALRRGFRIEPGQRVLAVEDVVTTGKSVREVIDLIKESGGELVGVAALVDRSGGRTVFDVPFRSLASITMTNYNPDDCPLCRQGIPAIKPGSRPTE